MLDLKHLALLFIGHETVPIKILDFYVTNACFVIGNAVAFGIHTLTKLGSWIGYLGPASFLLGKILLKDYGKDQSASLGW